jgi:hypothetical protein
VKLSKFDVQVREEFIRQAVRADPSVTGDQLQRLLHQHYGHKMRNVRLYEVKSQALKSLKRSTTHDEAQ